MKFGVREICNVVLKAKAAQKIGNKIFYAGEPVIYFDTLKTSSLEGAGTTVYAQGGRGNARLVAWEGERTVTFTMEDALISPEGFMILSGAGLIAAKDAAPVYQHITETVDEAFITRTDEEVTVKVCEKPYMPTDKAGNFAYVMFVKNGEIVTEPYIPVRGDIPGVVDPTSGKVMYTLTIKDHEVYDALANNENGAHTADGSDPGVYNVKSFPAVGEYDSVIVDYYTARKAGAQQIEIRADKFAGNYYLEAETLFRDQNGVDMPAEFIIPNCKIQSNFTFTMANTGDPSTFTFTMDAFPDYTRFDHSHKVLAAIQIIEVLAEEDLHRHATEHESAHDQLNLEW